MKKTKAKQQPKEVSIAGIPLSQIKTMLTEDFQKHLEAKKVPKLFRGFYEVIPNQAIVRLSLKPKTPMRFYRFSKTMKCSVDGHAWVMFGYSTNDDGPLQVDYPTCSSHIRNANDAIDEAEEEGASLFG